MIENIPIILPPIAMQVEFENLSNTIYSLNSKYTNSLIELEALYASLSYRAFQGEFNFLAESGIDEVEISLDEGVEDINSKRIQELKNLFKKIPKNKLSARDKQLLAHTEKAFLTAKEENLPILGSDFLQHIVIKHQLQHPFTFDDFQRAINEYDIDSNNSQEPYELQRDWFLGLLCNEQPFLRQELMEWTVQEEKKDEKGEISQQKIVTKRIGFVLNTEPYETYP